MAQSKVMTMLVYMNDDWGQDDGGRLRVLYDGRNYEPYAVEVPPVMGTVFGFLRADNSWHGHRPFSGERKVVQIAWVKDASELGAQEKAQQDGAVFQERFWALRAVSGDVDPVRRRKRRTTRNEPSPRKGNRL